MGINVIFTLNNDSMKTQILLLVLLVTMLSACTTDPVNTDATKAIIFNDLYTGENIPSQTFAIDNILEGEQGIKIRISKNSFTDLDGNQVTGQIDIELKEALSSVDMVMGNLSTTFNGKPLQSGGMFYLNATSNGYQPKLADYKSILMSVPSDSLLPGMSIFQGERDSLNAINWSKPEPIMSSNHVVDSTSTQTFDAFEKSHNILYSVEGFGNKELDYPMDVVDEVSRIAWEGAGLKITTDSTFKVGKHTVYFYKKDTLMTWSQAFSTKVGTNAYVTDQNVFYIFKLKKLGWANIDRLYSDPRTEDIELITNITNHTDFDYVYTTIVTQDMYLPRYQKKDGSYSFTKGDKESTKLPLGEQVTLIATSTKNDLTYFGFQTIEIRKKQTVDIELKVSSKGQIERALRREL